MTIRDLSPQILTRISTCHYDLSVDIHEGPERWDYLLHPVNQTEESDDDLPTDEIPAGSAESSNDYYPTDDYPEMFPIQGVYILLPVSRRHLPNLTVIDFFFSEDKTKLVCYLKDATFFVSKRWSGFLAIADRQPEGFYLTSVYHEWLFLEEEQSAPVTLHPARGMSEVNVPKPQRQPRANKPSASGNAKL